MSIETRKKMADARRGSKSHFWIDGRTATRRRRSECATFEYRAWRTAVFIRDGRACVLCGGVENIQADHIVPWCHNAELRLEVTNGRTLCLRCHKETPTYGHRVQAWRKSGGK